MLAHWEEVEWTRIDRGPLQADRQRLGAAAGCARAGVSRYRMGPHERAMPVHAHADEEEIFYVLGGSGVSWQAGRAYLVATGDCVVYLAGGEPHTMVAGEGGLDVLAFGSGSDTGMTWLPRANAWWMGPRWLPSDGPSPFRREAEAGPLELPEVEAQRPPTIVATQEVRPVPMRHGSVASLRRDLGRAAGSVLSGIKHIEVAPGACGAPFHCHSSEEEIFVVLDGAGTLRLGGESHAVRAGSVVARPAGTGIAHQYIAGEDGLVLLAFGTRDSGDMIWYPDSSKVALRGLGVVMRVEPVDDWYGET
jgi:uncharacterized cupin superfamily protein